MKCQECRFWVPQGSIQGVCLNPFMITITDDKKAPMLSVHRGSYTIPALVQMTSNYFGCNLAEAK